MTTDIALVSIPYLTIGGEVMEPIGLSFLASYLESKNFQIKGYDFSYAEETPEELCIKYNLHNYKRIGLSFYNTNANYAFELAKCIKSKNKNTLIIAGGAHVSAVYKTIFSSHPEIDIVVRNEGEIVTENLLNVLNSQADLSEVKGISYHINGKTFINDPAERVNELDILPAPIFNFEGNNHEIKHTYYDKVAKKKKNAIGLVSSRSCPYNCSFCAIILIGRAWRKCSPEKIVDDLIKMELAHKQVYNHIYFLDANFFVDVKRTIAVAKRLREYNPEITFSFSTRANQIVKAKEYMPDLVELGLRAIEVGIESGSIEALKRFGKDVKMEQNYETIQILKENNLELFLDFIMFDPECSIEDLSSNLNFILKCDLDSLVPWDHLYNPMTPYLGTKIRDRYEAILNIKFEDDNLPKTEELFINAAVRLIYLEFQKMDRYTEQLQNLIVEFEEIENYPNSNLSNIIVKANMVTIRRLPFVVLQNLVEQGRTSANICFKDALPDFYNSDYEHIGIDKFIKYTSYKIKEMKHESIQFIS